MALTFIERCAVEDEGEGPAVVCVHGLGGSSNTFTPLMPALARHRVVRIDLPGSGRSHRAEGALSMSRYADVVLSVCARLNVTRAHLVGHSMGNIVLQHVAVQSPKLVAGLALFGPLIAPPDTARTAIRARGEKAKAEGAAGMHEIALALLNASISADTRARLPLAVAFVRESLMRQDPDGYARSCFALADAPAAAVDQIEAPLLLVTGDEDVVAPPQAVRAMAEKLHRARSVRVVVLPKCGHWTPVERPEECARELRGVLGGAAVMPRMLLDRVLAVRAARRAVPGSGLLLWRSALQADSAVLLAARSRGETRYAHCVRCARTIAASQRWKHALRALPSAPLRCSPPHKSPPPGIAHRAATLVVFVEEYLDASAKPWVGVRRQRHCAALRSAGLVAARAMRALRSSDSPRLFESSERSERSEFLGGPRVRAPEGIRSEAEGAAHERRRTPTRGFASLGLSSAQDRSN